MIIRSSLARVFFPRLPPGIHPSTAQSALLSIGLLGGSFYGFYHFLKWKDSKSRERGRIEYYESAIKDANRRGYYVLNPVDPAASRRLPVPVTEHNARHHSIEQASSMGLLGEGIPRTQPAPQRAKGDGSELVYTKKDL